MKFHHIILVLLLFVPGGCGENIESSSEGLSMQDIAAAENLVDLSMTDSERQMMQPSLVAQQQNYQSLRKMELANSERPALRFDPEMGSPKNVSVTEWEGGSSWSSHEGVTLPDDRKDLAFYTIGELGHLIRTRQLSCLELTRFCLARLKEFDPQLECVITLTEERAIAQAHDLDAMLDRGEYLGPLHGIPYGAKDLLAVKGTLTTWGATPYKNQTIDETATVIKKLDDAGAVLVAKLTLGALAMDDVWFGGQTKNPWNLEEGSSGSSAGPASAVSAGLVPFAIGTETLGSIVSPSTRCGTTGLRPTFGRVSRHGAMALSWSMDKIGPITRSVEDCAIVLDAIHGQDPFDSTTVDKPFNYRPDIDLSGLRVGYLQSTFAEEHYGGQLDSLALETLKEAGAELVAFDFPLEDFGVPNPWDLIIILTAEAGAAFQGLTLSNQDDLLVRQRPNDWPDIFRSAQFIPAVEYIQANRARLRLQAMMKQVFESVDVYVTPSFAGSSLMVTNLTGHPQVVVPSGFLAENKPHSISFVGDLFDEATVLGVAAVYQNSTNWHKEHPPEN
jgi:Asp-tRNA(Asn)/Glu-tRNA(Gln) amidotransferase A subunit family amidase